MSGICRVPGGRIVNLDPVCEAVRVCFQQRPLTETITVPFSKPRYVNNFYRYGTPSGIVMGRNLERRANVLERCRHGVKVERIE
jgi:hypothetical protein